MQTRSRRPQSKLQVNGPRNCFKPVAFVLDPLVRSALHAHAGSATAMFPCKCAARETDDYRQRIHAHRLTLLTALASPFQAT
jgi:hypothetical protein